MITSPAAADSCERMLRCGGDGYDTLDYSLARVTIAVDLEQGTAEGEDIGPDSVASFEVLIGGSGDDDLRAGVAPAIDGGEGDDRLSDGAGSDTILGGEGDDDVRRRWTRPTIVLRRFGSTIRWTIRTRR